MGGAICLVSAVSGEIAPTLSEAAAGAAESCFKSILTNQFTPVSAYAWDWLYI